MTRTVLRRLAGAATSLVVAAAGVAILAAPAHAQPGNVFFMDLCDGTVVDFRSGQNLPEYVWTVAAGGETFFGEDDEQPAPGERLDGFVFVPSDAGTIEVDYVDSPAGFPETHDWSAPVDFCDDVADPIIIQPTCDEATGAIEFPAFPAGVDPDDLEFYVIPESDFPVDNFDDVDFHAGGETVTLEPGAYLTWLYYGPIDSSLKIFLEFEIVPAAGCADDDPDDDGEGGELPRTGTDTALLGVGAVLLLSVGGGLLLLARRRRTSFTS